MFRHLSAKRYQEYKERLEKNLGKGIKIFLKKKKQKSNNFVVNIPKISQKMQNKSLLSVGRNIAERERTRFYNYKKHLF